MNLLQKGIDFCKKMLYLCSGKRKKNTIENIGKPLLLTLKNIYYYEYRFS